MWDQWRTWADHYATSFFQSAEWAETLVRNYPFYRPEPLSTDAYFLPLIRHRRFGWISDSLYGMPMMSTGGLLAPEGDGEKLWPLAMDALRPKQVGTLVLSLPLNQFHHPPPVGFQSIEGSTHLVDLGAGWDQTLSGFKKSCKEAIRRAQRLCVQVEREENEAGIESHWGLIQGQFEKWKPKPPMTRPFIRDLVHLPQGRLYIARVDGRAVLSLLAFSYGGEVFLWQSAKVANDFPPGTSNLLTSRILQEACEEGIRSVNFGTSLDNRNIEAYKEAYGAVKTPYRIIKRVHPLLKWRE